MNITLGSLFDGAGGFPLAGVLAGFTPVWASEIEPFPIRVTSKRFPEMEHLGDVTKLDGGKIKPVDLITFGSPCQDLSIAGSRKGLGGERSSLFHQAIRVIKEMRIKTNGRYPRFIVWENVLGALSSNKGEDFRTVLEEIAKIKDTTVSIPRPDRGGGNKWMRAGEIVADDYSIAWRTYDAQYWGVPQRRKRIYLVADFAGRSAGKIQFEREVVLGDTPQGKKCGKGVAQTSTGNLGETVCLNDGSQMSVSQELTGTLRSEMHGNVPIVFESHNMDCRYRELKKVCETIATRYGTGGGEYANSN